MSINQILPKVKAVYADTNLRFLLMFLVVVVAPLIVLVSSGSTSLAQSRSNLFWGFLVLGVLLLVGLSLGRIMFNHKVRSLSISGRSARLPSVIKRILWIEQDDGVREEVMTLLRNAGYRVSSSGDRVEAMILSMTGHYDICLFGDWPPLEEESRLYERIRKFNPECPILFYSLWKPQEYLQREVEAGVWGYLKRPADDFALKSSIAALLDVAPSSVARTI